VPVAGGSLAMVLHLPASSPAPCVVACHGLGASKHSDKYRFLGAELPPAGLGLARFDFRGAGESSPIPGGATVATRLEDLRAILDHLARDPRIDAARIGLIGSSLGGFVALHAARRRPSRTPVVTWNAPATLRDLLRREASDGEPGPQFLVELREGVYADAPRGVRWLRVIQGDRDEVVPPAHARAIYEMAGEPRDLRIIAGGDHRLSEIRHRLEALTLSRDWFLLHL
jgi:fermentation-respiration switch protein FrsA (DUF1100 family)